MRIPELLFQLTTPVDAAGGMIGLVTREASSSALATTIALDLFTVPGDKILITNGLTCILRPGAGQTALRSRFSFATDPGAAVIEFRRSPGEDWSTVDAECSDNCGGCMWIPPGVLVRAVANFDAAVNANEFVASLHGILIPRGNIQQA